ncbi:unnamed protein product, partial [Urochloa humidicola]
MEAFEVASPGAGPQGAFGVVPALDSSAPRSGLAEKVFAAAGSDEVAEKVGEELVAAACFDAAADVDDELLAAAAFEVGAEGAGSCLGSEVLVALPPRIFSMREAKWRRGPLAAAPVEAEKHPPLAAAAGDGPGWGATADELVPRPRNLAAAAARKRRAPLAMAVAASSEAEGGKGNGVAWQL